MALYLIVMYLLVRVSLTGAEAMGYNWQWYRIPDYLYRLTDDGFQWGEISIGLVSTLTLSLQAFLMAMTGGLLVACCDFPTSWSEGRLRRSFWSL